MKSAAPVPYHLLSREEREDRENRFAAAIAARTARIEWSLQKTKAGAPTPARKGGQ